MMILTYQNKIPSVQIPLRYKERVGESSVTGDLWKAFKLGMQMIVLIIGKRFGLDNLTVKYLEKMW